MCWLCDLGDLKSQGGEGEVEEIVKESENAQVFACQSREWLEPHPIHF